MASLHGAVAESRIINPRTDLGRYLNSAFRRKPVKIYGKENGIPVAILDTVNSIEVESGSGRSWNIGTAGGHKIFVEID